VGGGPALWRVARRFEAACGTAIGAVALVLVIGVVAVVTRGLFTDPLPVSRPPEPPCDLRGAAPRRSPASVPLPRVVASQLCAPSALAFLPDGSALVAERNTARVLGVSADGEVREVQHLAEVETSGGGGLLGIAVSPTYEADGWIHVYFTTAVDNRIARFRLGDELEPILTGIPAGPAGNGGRIAFGPDRMLYAGTGDAGRPPTAQDPNGLAGKILRITPDGRPAPGNPDPDSPVWSRGHRDVRGLAWDSDGRLYASELGGNGMGELNLVEAGGDYGWPGLANRPSTRPIATWAGPTAPGGIAVLAGTLYVACRAGERLRRFGPDGAPDGALLASQYGQLSDVAIARDGSLWILTANRDGRGVPVAEDDRILRLSPSDTPRRRRR
jgi:glucose/arabinose dehydrogenase